MPSKHEGSPRVIGESIIAGTPVVAYELENYRPLFGEFARYARPFDLAAFQHAAEEQILRMRAGDNYLDGLDRAKFEQENGWTTTAQRFLAGLAGQ
jgi:glycosyltransferase involved in cell wall biosynthesis